MKKKKKRRLIWAFVILLGLLFKFGCDYMFNYAFVRSEKDFINSKDSISVRKAQNWLKKTKKETWYENSADGKLKLVANFVPAESFTNKTIVVFHGYTKNKEHMADYIHLFHKAGYNVLAPDARASGESEGKVIGYGWPERKDNLRWINQIIKRTGGSKSEIGLFGVSMGGASVMYLAGESLPSEVKVLVEDCGYSSIRAELTYQLYQMFKLPSFPLIQGVNIKTRVRGGYDFNEADATKQLQKNKLPILFIHGSNDKFVPTKMIYDNYKATSAPKKMLIVKGASHANSFEKEPQNYRNTVIGFIRKYMP